MKLTFILFVSLLIGLQACVPLDQSSASVGIEENGNIAFEDQVYEENIRTVQLYPFSNTTNDNIQPAVLSMNQANRLRLEFDDLIGDYQDYYVKIIHCNANWKSSKLNEMEYLNDFNEFPIQNYELSFNTRVPFVHYQFSVPKVKLSGNYMLFVYRDRDEAAVVLSRRFMVYENIVNVDAEVVLASGVAERRQNQQIDFEILYPANAINDPDRDIKVVLRQNQRWDNAITNLKPTMIREAERVLEYRHFNFENNFMAGNQYRFFDLRTLNFVGQNVQEVKLEEDSAEAFLFVDKDRGREVFAQYPEINGNFTINNLEVDGGPSAADYVTVNFVLNTGRPINGDVYIFGALTDWKRSPEGRMVYDDATQTYTGNLLLKQGWYNYQYLVEGDNSPYLVEGSHFETENEYEIFFYNRPIGARADRLVGYRKIMHNPQR